MKDNNVILEVKDLHKSFGEQEVFASEHARMKEFLGKFHQG